MTDKIIITEVRNAVSLNEDDSSFEVEINHPQHGWTPYTADLEANTPINDASVIEAIGSNYAAFVPPTQAELDAEEEAIVRAERDNKLVNDVDPLVSNPLRWADLTADKQGEWTAYRTALLDVPTQSGFPDNVTWPTKP